MRLHSCCEKQLAKGTVLPRRAFLCPRKVTINPKQLLINYNVHCKPLKENDSIHTESIQETETLVTSSACGQVLDCCNGTARLGAHCWCRHSSACCTLHRRPSSPNPRFLACQVKALAVLLSAGAGFSLSLCHVLVNLLCLELPQGYDICHVIQ